MAQIPDIDKTKWGFDQIGVPAPLWYRRFTNAMIVCFIPAYTGFVDIIHMSEYERTIYLHIGVAIPFVLKGFAMIMGNGQVYFPSNKAVDMMNKRDDNYNNIKSILLIVLLFLFINCIFSL